MPKDQEYAEWIERKNLQKMLIFPDSIKEFREILKPRDFSSAQNRAVYEEILAADERGLKDSELMIAVKDALENRILQLKGALLLVQDRLGATNDITEADRLLKRKVDIKRRLEVYGEIPNRGAAVVIAQLIDG